MSMLAIQQGPIPYWSSINEIPVTSLLIYLGGLGALGDQSELDLNDNFDFSNVMGWTSPSDYCSATPLIYHRVKRSIIKKGKIEALKGESCETRPVCEEK